MRRVVEIAHDNRHLHVERGFLVVDDVGDTRGELGRVPFADIEAVIAHGHGITYSNAVLVHLAEESAPLVVVDSHHMVVGMLLSCAGNSVQAHRFEAQIGASRPANKRVWAQIVRAKVMQQAAVLEAVGQSGARLRALAGSVRSGDPGNIEAQAARSYWPALFGTSFRRGSGGREPNGFLNYGYTVLRASTARAVVAAGLHPAIGIHHSNDANPMRLVDDLMEPFRPFMDLQTWLLWRDGHADLGKAEKTRLVEVMMQDLDTPLGASPIGVCVQSLATSLVRLYLGEADRVVLPAPQIPSVLQEAVDGGAV